MNRQALLQKITQPEERLLFAKVLDQAALCCKKHEMVFTDFLDMEKSGKFLEKLQYERDLQVMAFGGNIDCERRMLGFAPDYMTLAETDFPIQALRITKHKKFGQTTKDIAPYIATQLQKVSRTPVQVEETTWTALDLEKEPVLQKLTVASLRLDAVAGGVLHVSRGKIQALIDAEKANVNWNTITQTSYLLKEGDMVSVRGFGRFRIVDIGGKSKKDRVILEVEVYR